ncbi:37S ribosomal protein rsm22 [Camillea tinctor]|nr:37S ribosomal protein rsm22 [Camillea tinctor]
MSVEIWPHIAPDQLKIEEDATQARELTWLLASLRTTLQSLKRGLEDSYALLAPIDPGSTLVLSTPRNETVKGHVTRVGTRLVKGTVHLRLRTLPAQTLSLDPGRPIAIGPLESLHGLLTSSIELVGLCVSDAPSPAALLASQLRLLSQHLGEASALIKGGPGADLWARASVALAHFAPPLSRNLSFYLTVQDASLVLYLRALEPAGAPLNFGAKLALAIGTARRLEHDEADRVFAYRCDDDGGEARDNRDAGHRLDVPGARRSSSQRRPVSAGSGASAVSGGSSSNGHGGVLGQGGEVEVYVREKVRVESADPSLLSLSAKLSALSNTLSLARRNLAAVMGEEFED